MIAPIGQFVKRNFPISVLHVSSTRCSAVLKITVVKSDALAIPYLSQPDIFRKRAEIEMNHMSDTGIGRAFFLR